MGATCDVCFSYSHPYLERCVGCGGPNADYRFPQVLREWWNRDSGRPREEAEAAAKRMFKDMWDTMSEDRREAYIGIKERESAWEHRRSLAKYRENMMPGLGSQLRDVGLRYTGGIPGHPAPIDVRAEQSASEIIISAAGGVATIPISSILAAVEFNNETSLGWYGIQFGNAIGFSQPTMQTSGWLITFGRGGQMHQFGLMARGGLFSKKPMAGFFWVQNMAIATAEGAVEAAELEMGPVEYARELGLDVTGLEAPPTPAPAVDADPQGDGIRGSLEKLEELRGAGLISPDEYAERRKVILDRL